MGKAILDTTRPGGKKPLRPAVGSGQLEDESPKDFSAYLKWLTSGEVDPYAWAESVGQDSSLIQKNLWALRAPAVRQIITESLRYRMLSETREIQTELVVIAKDLLDRHRDYSETAEARADALKLALSTLRLRGELIEGWRNREPSGKIEINNISNNPTLEVSVLGRAFGGAIPSQDFSDWVEAQVVEKLPLDKN